MPRCFVLSVSLVLFACSSSTDECTEVPIESIAGPLQLVRYNEPQRWADADYPAIVAAEPVSAGGSVVEGNARATRWLQAWADHFDGVVRSQAERELGTTLVVPKPTVVLVDAPQVPASVPAVMVEVQSPTDPELGYLAIVSRARPPTTAPGFTAVLPTPSSWPELPELMTHVQRHAGVGNVVEREGRYTLPCSEWSHVEGGIAMFAVAPYVRVDRATLRTMSADAALTMLAHEMAHIYRAHATSVTASPHYFYERSAGGRWEAPAGDQAALERAYLAAEGGPTDGVEPTLLEKARANEIGLMTVESQADRLADHLLIRGGLTAEEIVEARLELAQMRYDQGPTADQCAELRQQEFRDEGGAPRFMPIGGAPGDLVASGHPGACYRVFDAWRELALHVETPGARPNVDIEWEDARDEL